MWPAVSSPSATAITPCTAPPPNWKTATRCPPRLSPGSSCIRTMRTSWHVPLPMPYPRRILTTAHNRKPAFSAGTEKSGMLSHTSPLPRMPQGRTTQIQGANQDITERKRLEAQSASIPENGNRRQSGGGIAHKFNSILTAIIGQSDLLLGLLPPDGPLMRTTRPRSANPPSAPPP